MLKPTGLDRAAVRDQFDAHRDPLARGDFLLREIERRLLERLDPIRIEPAKRILDLGCGLGASFGPLAVRYPGACLVGGDLAVGALASGAGRPGHADRLRDGARRWLNRLGVGGDQSPPATDPLRVGLDAHALPFAANSFDLIWSNLMLHWLDDPLAALAEWGRIVRPGGVVIFSAFGVDAFAEARPTPERPATDGSRPPSSWPSLQDMHDWGDALVAAGFSDPVLETERLTLTFTQPERYQADVESLAMIGADDRAAFRARPASDRLTLELVYGHAWAPERKGRADGLATVEFHRQWRRM